MKTVLAILAAAALSLAALATAPAPLAADPSASQWAIGPIIKGRNYSVNMPRTLTQGRDGPYFDFPYPTAADGHVHYITVPIRSLKGARRITLRYRIDAAPGVRFVPQEQPDRKAVLSLYFQRAGDRWTSRTPTHRWYAPSDRVMPLRPGVHEVSISLDEAWIGTMGGNSRKLPREFAAALVGAARIGFTFGSPHRRGHGVFATKPARFTILEFDIE